MSVLLKKVFAKSKDEKYIEKSEKKQLNDQNLSELLGDFTINITGDVDAIYTEVA
jgi:hypothetical protein